MDRDLRRRAYLLERVSHDEELPVIYWGSAYTVPVTLILIIAIIMSMVQAAIGLRRRETKAFLITTLVFVFVGFALAWVIPFIARLFTRRHHIPHWPGQLPLWMQIVLGALVLTTITLGAIEDISLLAGNNHNDNMKIATVIFAGATLFVTIIMPFIFGFILLENLEQEIRIRDRLKMKQLRLKRSEIY